MYQDQVRKVHLQAEPAGYSEGRQQSSINSTRQHHFQFGSTTSTVEFTN
jgi:hypothetical protein